MVAKANDNATYHLVELDGTRLVMAISEKEVTKGALKGSQEKVYIKTTKPKNSAFQIPRHSIPNPFF